MSSDFGWQMFYGAYVCTYIERDVRELSYIGDEVKFTRYITAVAAATGQLLNVASLSRDVGISQPTAVRWLSILVTSNLVYLLQPYSNTITKRAIKTPELNFPDVGLAAFAVPDKIPNIKRGLAGVICMYDNLIALKDEDRVIPVKYL